MQIQIDKILVFYDLNIFSYKKNNKENYLLFKFFKRFNKNK